MKKERDWEKLVLEYFKLFSKELGDSPVVEQKKRMEEIRKELNSHHQEILNEAREILDKAL